MKLDKRIRAKKLARRFPKRHNLVTHTKTVVNKETGVETVLVRPASKGMDIYPIPTVKLYSGRLRRYPHRWRR